MMKSTFSALYAAVLLVLPSPSVEAREAAEWQSLFSGKDLAGWHGVGGPATNWDATDGVLRCTGEPGSQWLRTDREYANFELELEFNIPKDGNSGVFVRAPAEGVPWVEGLEIQVLDDYGPKWADLRPNQYTGAIYAAEAPSKRATKPAGQWQSMRVRLDGRRCAVWVNGEQVVDADLDALAEKHPNLRGLKRDKGYIGLQNHSSPVSYRNIRIRELGN